MASLRAGLVAASMLVVAAGAVMGACSSPEARRVRDGGPGADPGNKILIDAPVANPHAADTTLWPGRAPAPVERLADGTMPPPPAPPAPSPAGPARRR